MGDDVPVAGGGPGARPEPLHAPRDVRQSAALAAVLDVAVANRLDPDGAGVWRAGSAVLVGLPAVPALARVDEPAREGDARRQVRVAELLADHGVPAVRITGPPEQPVPTGAGPVTVWAWEPPVGPAVTPADLGRTARNLHDRTRGLGAVAGAGSAVPVHDPLAAVRAELARAAVLGHTSDDDLARLDEVVDRVAAAWPAPDDDPLGAALVHGDLHRGNVVPGRSGPVLADLELAGRGPASADLAPSVVAVRRYGVDPAALEQVLTGYGADPRGWPGLEVLVEAYELWVTAWAVANRGASERAEREAEVRLDRWRSGASAPWSLH
ncbi:MAG TPA: aminoglycoside phosphotransferase family protein [Acidimicrobiales bacterium]